MALNHKLRSGINWQGALNQKGIKQTGLKQGLYIFFLLLPAAFKSEKSPLRHGWLLWPNSCMFCLC